MGPIDTTVAPRPTLPQAGSASTGLSTSNDVLQKLNDQLSLSEGLTKRRQEFATTGQGRQIYDALSDPSKVMTGIDPNANLKQGIDIRSGYESSIAKAGTNTTDILTQLAGLIRQQKQDENTVIERKMQIAKLNEEVLKPKNLKMDENGEVTGLSAEELAANGPILKKGTQAVSEVLKQGGSDVLNQAKDVNARTALAEEILKTGGVSEYRKQLPLDSLLNDAERTEIQKNATLLSQIDQAIPVFSSGDKSGGTGPIAGLLPGFISPEKTREMRRQVGAITTQFQQLISGKVISDKEVKRLAAFLPNQYKSESENMGDLVKLKSEIEKNMSLFEKAKQEGITANQAYDKYGKETIQGQSGTIKVKRKSDGKVGSMPESNFNPSLYERI